MDGAKRGYCDDESSGAVHLKVVPRYFEKFRESSVVRDFAEAVRDRFKTEGVDLKVILSIEEQRAFMGNMANSRDEVEGETEDVDED